MYILQALQNAINDDLKKRSSLKRDAHVSVFGELSCIHKSIRYISKVLFKYLLWSCSLFIIILYIHLLTSSFVSRPPLLPSLSPPPSFPSLSPYPAAPDRQSEQPVWHKSPHHGAGQERDHVSGLHHRVHHDVQTPPLQGVRQGECASCNCHVTVMWLVSQVVCGNCSQQKAYLPYLAKMERVCKPCFIESKNPADRLSGDG